MAQTTRPGEYVGGVTDSLRSSLRKSGHVGRAVAVSNAVTVFNYKNQGFYVTGNAPEVWVTAGTPSNVPPSGHPLIEIGFDPIQP